MYAINLQFIKIKVSPSVIKGGMPVLVETLNSHNNLNNNYLVYFTKYPQQYYVAKFKGYYSVSNLLSLSESFHS